MTFLSKNTGAVLAILALALVARLAAGYWWHARLGDESRFVFPDSQSYWVLAQQLARGDAYEFGTPHSKVFRMPGYPILLAGLFRVLGDDDPSVLYARVLNAFLGTISVGGILWLTRQLFNMKAALWAGLLAAVYPGALGMSVFVLSEAPFAPLMVGQFIAWIAAWRARRPGSRAAYAILAGVCAALATLTRPSWLLFTPFALVIGICTSSPRRRHVEIGIEMLLAFSLVMLPWWIRNYEITGHFVPTTLQVGASLYDGWNPRATGASDMSYVPQFQQQQIASDARQDAPPESVFEYRLDRRMNEAAWRWARQHPRRVLELMGIKFLRMWNVWPNATEMRSTLLRWITLVSYLPLLMLALIGIWKFAARDWPYLLCVIPAVYFTALHVVFVSSIRYREPAMFILIALAAGALGSYQHQVKQRKG